MKKFLLLTFLTLIFGFSQIAEAQDANQELKIQVNEQKSAFNNDLTVKFVSVLEDSRCPEGTNCIWAGNAKIKLKLKKKNGAWETFELNTNLEKNIIEFGKYKIKIAELSPYPSENVRINSDDYTATFNIEKSN